jgi:DNA repair exonuclease SbcCD ATPase subunit
LAKQKAIMEEHTETCRSMLPGMGMAFTSVRERILSVDVNRRIQLDGEELRLARELKRARESELALKDEIAKLKTERNQEKDKATRLADHSRTIIAKNEALHVSKSDMEQKIKDLEEKDSSAQSDIAIFKRQVRFLKRKRKDNASPPASRPTAPYQNIGQAFITKGGNSFPATSSLACQIGFSLSFATCCQEI